MKFDNKIIFMIVIIIGLYSIFLMLSDFEAISNQVLKFKIEYLPVILLVIPLGWIILFGRWLLLLQHAGVKVPFKECCKIYFAGFALGITPGKTGELIKSQLMKTKFDTPKRITAPLVIAERIYDLVGGVAVSFLGLWFLFDLANYALLFFSVLIVLLFLGISSRKFFNIFIKVLQKIPFLSNTVKSMSESYEIIRSSCRGKIAFLCSLITIVAWLVHALAIYFIVLALGIDKISYLQIVPLFSLSSLLGAVSLIPGGLGVTEASMAGLFTHYGIEFGLAVGVAIIIRIFTLWYAVIVGFIFLKLSGGLSIGKNLK